jgi:hypothetical protein
LSSLRLELAPSVALAAALVGMHAAAAACVALVVPGAAGAALAAALLALGLAVAWSRALLRSPASVRAIDIDGPGIVLQLAGGASLPVEVAGRRFVSRFMVTLPVLRPVRRTVLVTADMLGSAEFRRLRIWALWGKLGAVAPKQLPA